MGKCAKNGDRVVTLNQHRQPLIQKSFLAAVISNLSDAPSRSSKHSIPSLLMAPVVSAAIGMNKNACVSGAYFAVCLSAAASAAAPDVWDGS